MKTAQPKSPASMSPATRAAIAAVLDTDPALTAEQRARVLSLCDTIGEPGPAPAARGMSASAAARYLGKHPATLSRWIAEGKLTGEKVDGRFLLSPARSVEAMRASISPAARADLPDRLEHLAPVVEKSRRG